MWDIFLKLCSDNLPTVVLIMLIVLGGAVFLTYKLCKFYFVRFKGIETKINAHDNSLKEIKSTLDKICAILVNKVDEKLLSDLYQSNSPLKLTAKGEELLTISGMKKAIDSNLDYFYTHLKDTKPENEGDIEFISTNLILKDFDSHLFGDVREFLYEHPVYNEKPIGMSEIVRIGTIYLCDLYLQKYPFLK